MNEFYNLEGLDLRSYHLLEAIIKLRKEAERHFIPDGTLKYKTPGNCYLQLNNGTIRFVRVTAGEPKAMSPNHVVTAYRANNSNRYSYIFDSYEIVPQVLTIIEDCIPELKNRLRESRVQAETDDWLG